MRINRKRECEDIGDKKRKRNKDKVNGRLDGCNVVRKQSKREVDVSESFDEILGNKIDLKWEREDKIE